MNDRPQFADLTLTQQIRDYAIDQGMDLVGVAPIARLGDLSAGFAPTEYMPEARCVISIVCALADGMCDVWGTYEEDGKVDPPAGLLRRRQRQLGACTRRQRIGATARVRWLPEAWSFHRTGRSRITAR